MIHSSLSSSPRPSLADAINQVRTTGKADFLLASGQVAKLTRVKLLQNYESILHMAGIEQVLGESIGLTPGSEGLKIANAELSRFADVPAYWVMPLGERIHHARRLESLPVGLLNRVADLKVVRDAVMHGELAAFGKETRKAIRQAYEDILQHGMHTPTEALRARIEAVSRAKADNASADEMLSTLRTLYQAIESEVEIRTAIKEAGIFKGILPHVESIFELMRASDLHRKIFKRDNLAWKFRASALVRNHLVHGSILTPTKRQSDVVEQAHQLLGQAVTELRFKQAGGRASAGEFRNGINL
jgi:uncharacterized membrane protein